MSINIQINLQFIIIGLTILFKQSKLTLFELNKILNKCSPHPIAAGRPNSALLMDI